MQVWINPNTGFRDRSFRPYINGENEQRFGSMPYDPNGRSFNHGLYEKAGQPTCDMYPSVLREYRNIGGNPSYSYTKQGNVIHDLRTCSRR